MAGKFITFEGPEGSGKSTQIRLLTERLEAAGLNVVLTREPGGTATGEMIRNLLQHDAAGEPLSDRSELLLFTASRAQLMDRLIRPALERDEWVLCDRFIDSTIAYQGFARGMDISTLEAINTFAIYEREPDLTILLDLEVEAGFSRLESRYADSDESHDRFECEARDFHHRVRDGYLQLAEQNPTRFRRINSDRPIEEVAHDVWVVVQEALMA